MNKDLLPMRHASVFDGAGEIPYSIAQSTRTGLYTTYEYPEFVPVIPIRWEALAGIPV